MRSPLAMAVAARVTRLRRFTRDTTRYVGIDVGNDRVRVATLGIPRDGILGQRWAYGWLAHSEFPLPIDPAAPPSPKWVELLTETLHERLPRCVDGDSAVAILSMPPAWIHYQTNPVAELASAQAQCDAMFRGSIFQSPAHLKHWPIVAGNDQQVVVATAHRAACRVAESVRVSGYQVQSILPHGAALLHAAGPLTSCQPAAVVLLEPTGGMIALNNEHGCGLCRNLPPCPVAADRVEHFDDIESWIKQIAGECLATLRYESRLGGNLDPQAAVLICGSVAQLDGVDAAIASALGRPVATWRYAGRRRPTSHHLPGGGDAGSAVALSLAYAAIGINATSRRRVS